MNARDHALLQLDARTFPDWPQHSVRRDSQRTMQDLADARDAALAEQLYIGVVKNLLHLQHLIEHYSGRRLTDIEPAVQKILAIGLYQLRFLTRIPASAAVNEAVQQAKRFRQIRAAGMVNAVLRNATRQPPPADPTDPTDYARLVLSHPAPLFAKVSALLGADGALEFCRHNNRQAPIIVRTSHSLADVTPHEQPGFAVVEHAIRAQLKEWADQGIAFVQDPTAGAVAPMLEVRQRMIVLDRCCGLGTKTIQLRQSLGDSGELFAMDPSPARMEILANVIATHGWKNIRLLPHAWLKDVPAPLPENFDRILIDAPCSNSGVLGRRAEARYHQTDAAIKSLAKTQDALLADCIPRLAPDGLLVYSTCSIWPEENHARIAPLLDRFELVQEHTTYPSAGDDPRSYHDGGYWAILRLR